MGRPFKVESNDIKYLKPLQLTQLLKELLNSEAYKCGIAKSTIDVALNITVADGGEDGRINWDNGPDFTDYLPNRLTMFQNKATNMSPNEYANEILEKKRDGMPRVLKQKVEEVLENGGAYVFFTTQELNSDQKEIRITAIREKLQKLGKAYADSCCIDIYDASKISSWTNEFITTIVSVQHWVGRPMERGLKTFNLWKQNEDLSRIPYADVKSRKEIVSSIGAKIAQPKSCFRIIGLSGLGKTRTAFQVFEENKTLQNLVVYVDANHAPTIDSLIADWIGMGLRAIIVVDNCEYRLHERLVKEVLRQGNQISILTLDYNFEVVSPVTECFKLNPMTDEELLLLLRPIYESTLPDIQRIVKFAQGFPQMAVLLAEARLAEDPHIGELTEDDLANKLLWGSNEEECPAKLKILQVCSLFDSFGVEGGLENQLEFIAQIIGDSIDNVYECVQIYSDRGLIDRRGRYGQIVPKPLAIRLVAQWWTRTTKNKQLKVLEEIPKEMIESFCLQIEKMDFHPKVKELTKNLCGFQGPFGQTEVILSEQGSRFFRSFVVVNPEATCEALYKSIVIMDVQQLQTIKGSIRRNLVCALEKLCFHERLFSKAAWSLLLLASAETETWGNNATQMFSQLFSIHLSGTEAEPRARFDLLERALKLNENLVDMIVLRALERAINVSRGSRMGGAEYQGIKAPLMEWKPVIWKEIFDYLQEAFNLLIQLSERGESQREKVLSIIGHSIIDLIKIAPVRILDSAIKHMVNINGQYWPEALDSIKKINKYSKDKLNQDTMRALISWEELLSPDKADLPEKLKILVINPPMESEIGDGGHYVDVASERAKALGVIVAKELDTFLPHLGMLLQGEQGQSYSFGFQLSLALPNAKQLLEQSLEQYKVAYPANPNFILGLFHGIFEKSPDQWNDNINNLLEDRILVHLYPQLIRTGRIQKVHLDNLLELIRSNVISPQKANVLSYGSVTINIKPEIMMDFCLSLAEYGDDAMWTALHIIYMYCFGNKDNIKFLRNPLKKLVSTAPLYINKNGKTVDIYHWYYLAEELLKEVDKDFAIELANQLIIACEHGFNYSDIWDYIKKFLLNLMRSYGETLWPIFSREIIEAKELKNYWLNLIFARENSISLELPCVLSVVSIDDIITWCKEYPEQGPLFVANSINIFDTVDNNKKPSDLFISLVIEFGTDEHVIRALKANMASGSWQGSLVPYLKAEKLALSTLLEHESANVRFLTKEIIVSINKKVDEELIRDEEMALWNI